MKAYEIKVTLKYSNPVIWRKFIIPEKVSFKRLHDTIQFAMGWYDCHLHEFVFEEDKIIFTNNIEAVEETKYYKSIGKPQRMEQKDSSKVKIDKYIKKYPKFTYEYDFGDAWEHELEVLREIEEYPFGYPSLIGGEGDCPPEDCGGIGGYERLLEILKDSNSPDHREMKTWAKSVGYTKFNLKKTNSLMNEILILKKIIK